MKAKYKVIPEGNRVKFKKTSKYDYDFKKGQLGMVLRILSPFPSATDTIYQVMPDNSNDSVWVVGEDIESFNQLALDVESASDFDTTLNADKIKRLCPASLYTDAVYCVKEKDHDGFHKSSGGVTWQSSKL